MPYITAAEREALINGDPINTVGQLNYAITRLVDAYLYEYQENYRAINSAIGVLECAKLELYRRIAAPYEDQKIEENGDVYSCWG